MLLPEYVECGTYMDADGFSIVENRAGITFGVELYVPWDTPEMVVDLSLTGTVPLRNVPDVFGMIGRRDSATESRILQGRDARSIQVLVPDCRGLDQNFHDVTVVDMGDLPESHVSIPELSELAHKWPPAVINHMRWRQPELEDMRKAAKVQYRKKQPARCEFCGTLIRCDMYRHVARCHLDLDLDLDFAPAYGVQLHDPRLLEYVGAPESARLTSRSPEYWVHHMDREKALSAALQTCYGQSTVGNHFR